MWLSSCPKFGAAGYDGWFADDLKILLHEAIKVEKTKTMSHCKPITILGQIYRLMTKIAADQILAVWAVWLPPTISGGIPGCGPGMLMLAHQCRLEQSILQNSQLGGFVPDLIKAFNSIARRPLVHISSNDLMQEC